MNENPYDILGVARDASMDEVKKAYRKRARENHPDLNPDDPAAEERMNKINEAYDRIINPEKYAASDARKRGYGAPYTPGYNGHSDPRGGSSQTGYTGGSQSGSGQDPYGWTTIDFDEFFGGGWGSAQGPMHPEANASDPPDIQQAIYDINATDYRGALEILQRIPSTGRNSRWYYLFALAHNGLGNTVAAQDNIRRALEREPNNPEYLRAQSRFTQRARTYTQQGQQRGFNTGGIDPSLLCCCICLGPSFCSYLSRMCLYSGFF